MDLGNDKRDDTVIIDVSSVDTPNQFHELLKKSLNFPDYYGMNWNAFWDLISKYVPLPSEIIVNGWDHLRLKIPEDTKWFIYFINEYNNDDSDYRCMITYN